MVLGAEGDNPARREAAISHQVVSQPATPALHVDTRGVVPSVAAVTGPGQVPQRRTQQDVPVHERRSLTLGPGGTGGDGIARRSATGDGDSGIGHEPAAPVEKATGGGTGSESGESSGTFSGPRIKIDLTALFNRIQAGGGDIDSDVTRIVPVKDNYRLIHSFDEEEQRGPLLERVTIDERGIAISKDEDTGITTSLVAVRIQDNEATVVPFERDEQGLVLPLPGDTGSQIGFFISHDGDEGHKPCAVIRQGDYPGIPLTTDKITDTVSGEERTREILINMRGITEQERDEATWAEQVGLFDDLGFDPFKTRGIFSKSHRDNPHSTTWKNQRIVIVPDEMRDLVDHHDAWDVTKDILQILTYGTQRVKQTLVRDQSIWPDMFGGGSQGTLGTEKAMYAPRSLGVGFGNETTQQATTTSTKIAGLTSAFQIRVAPREN
jgi:hypothetical protein